MEKHIVYSQIPITQGSFRTRENIISVELAVLFALLVYTPGGRNKRNLFWLYQDKDRRVFLPDGNGTKIHSFGFPFRVQKEGNSFRCFDLTSGELIEEATHAFLQVFFSFFFEKNGGLEDMVDCFLATCEDLGCPETDSQAKFAWRIIVLLLTFEPGYLRYDHDELNANPVSHPLHHIDFNYEAGNTFKLGVAGLRSDCAIDIEQLGDLLGFSGQCKHIHL